MKQKLQEIWSALLSLFRVTTNKCEGCGSKKGRNPMCHYCYNSDI